MGVVETLNLHYLLLAGLLVGMIVNYNFERRERNNFVKLRIIIEERMNLSSLKGAHHQAGRKGR